MTAVEYQAWSQRTAEYPQSYIYGVENEEMSLDHNGYARTFPFYLCLGLAGEAGEVIECFKKFWRKQTTSLTQEEKEKVKLELGDVLWYVTQICTELDLSLEDVFEANKNKLQARLANNGYYTRKE